MNRNILLWRNKKDLSDVYKYGFKKKCKINIRHENKSVPKLGLKLLKIFNSASKNPGKRVNLSLASSLTLGLAVLQSDQADDLLEDVFRHLYKKDIKGVGNWKDDIGDEKDDSDIENNNTSEDTSKDEDIDTDLDNFEMRLVELREHGKNSFLSIGKTIIDFHPDSFEMNELDVMRKHGSVSLLNKTIMSDNISYDVNDHNKAMQLSFGDTRNMSEINMDSNNDIKTLSRETDIGKAIIDSHPDSFKMNELEVMRKHESVSLLNKTIISDNISYNADDHDMPVLLSCGNTRKVSEINMDSNNDIEINSREDDERRITEDVTNNSDDKVILLNTDKSSVETKEDGNEIEENEETCENDVTYKLENNEQENTDASDVEMDECEIENFSREEEDESSIANISENKDVQPNIAAEMKASEMIYEENDEVLQEDNNAKSKVKTIINDLEIIDKSNETHNDEQENSKIYYNINKEDDAKNNLNGTSVKANDITSDINLEEEEKESDTSRVRESEEESSTTGQDSLIELNLPSIQEINTAVNRIERNQDNTFADENVPPELNNAEMPEDNLLQQHEDYSIIIHSSESTRNDRKVYVYYKFKDNIFKEE